MSSIKKIAQLPLLLLLSFFIHSTAFAIDPIHENWRGSAIDGYDPVAYFKESKAVEGSSDFVHEWNDSKWYFSSAENKKDFIADPTKYAPQYGGYCAWAVSQGYSAKTDPKAWKVEDGKLYLNYNQEVREKWLMDIPGHIKSADKNWPDILAE